MSPAWEDIQDWDPAALRDAADDLSTRRQTLLTAAQDSEAAHAGIASTGDAVDQMKTTLSNMTDDLDQLMSEASELMMATAEAADGVWQVQTKVIECHDYAHMHRLTINGDGSVRGSFIPGITDIGSQLREREARNLEKLIQDVLELAAETDTSFAQRLGALSDGTFEGAEDHSPGLPDLPDENWSATEVAAWWNSLSQSERDALIEHHPDKIGNLDGVPMSARDKANRIRLPHEIGIATKELEEARDKYAETKRKHDEFQLVHLDQSSPFAAELDARKAALDAAQRKVDDLRAVDYTLREKEIVNERLPKAEEELADLSKTDPQDPKAAELRSEIEQLKNRRNELEVAEPRSLIYLDPREADEDVRAAIAVGDVDNAADVASLTPGISTTARGGSTAWWETPINFSRQRATTQPPSPS